MDLGENQKKLDVGQQFQKVFLKKIGYRIVDQAIEQVCWERQEPVTLSEEIPNLVDG